MRPSKRATQFTVFAVSYMAGLWFGHLGLRFWSGWALMASALLLLGRHSRWKLVLIGIVGLTTGLVWFARSDLAYQPLRHSFGRNIQITGSVSDDPSLSDKGYTEFTLNRLVLDGRPVAGNVRITTSNRQLSRGYRVLAVGKLKPGLGSSDAETFATVTVLSSHQDFLERWRQQFLAGVRTTLPSPTGELALGLLLGARTLLPKDLQQTLAVVGLSHLVAVSGYNLTILVNALYRPLRKISKFWAASLSVWAIGGFLLVSGFSPSIERAAVVSSLILLTGYYGRRAHPLTLLGLAAVITTVMRPASLWSDAGWQLSFLAFFGVLVLAPVLSRKLPATLAESVAAQVMTLPLIAAVFGQLPVYGVLANAVVLPLVPLAMLLSFLAGVAALVSWQIAAWVGAPAVWLLDFIIRFTSALANWRFASVPISLSTGALAVIYALVLACILLATRSKAGRSLRAYAIIHPKGTADVGTLEMVDDQT